MQKRILMKINMVINIYLNSLSFEFHQHCWICFGDTWVLWKWEVEYAKSPYPKMDASINEIFEQLSKWEHNLEAWF